MHIVTEINKIVFRKPERYRPTTPVFVFSNTGNTVVFVNGKKLLPGEDFGSDDSDLLAAGLVRTGGLIKVVHETTYEVAFGAGTLLGTGTTGNNPECTIFEKHYKMKK